MSMAEVRLQEGESIDNALRRFKRKVQTEDIIKEVKRHSFYLKPAAKRRVKQALRESVPEKRFAKNPIKLQSTGGPPAAERRPENVEQWGGCISRLPILQISMVTGAKHMECVQKRRYVRLGGRR
jgi:small subunit ribosomal protein S21